MQIYYYLTFLGGHKSKMGLTKLKKSRGQHRGVPSGDYQREILFVPFPAFRDCPCSLTHGPSIFKASRD